MTSGLVSGAAFPILAGKRFVGVIELFTTHRMPHQPEWQDMMEAVGREIGEFAHRRQIDERLRRMRKESLDRIRSLDASQHGVQSYVRTEPTRPALDVRF